MPLAIKKSDAQMTTNATSSYRWVILALATLTAILGQAAPSICMSVLFKEISTDLHLDLVQVGIVWGISALPSVALGLLAGALTDRVGAKKVLIISCGLVALTGALRGAATNFYTLILAVLLFGSVYPFLAMSVFKMLSQWFPAKQMGMANGVFSMGMAAGFMLGSAISASILSPALGGWRNALIFYAIFPALLALAWAFARSPHAPAGAGVAQPGAMRASLGHVMRVKQVWMLALVLFGTSGCVQSALGYLPTYLRGQGWQPVNADNAAGLFHLASLVCVLPISLWTDRADSRKRVLLMVAPLIPLGVAAWSVAGGAAMYAAIVVAGMTRDGFMGGFVPMIPEIKQIGAKYVATATGLVTGVAALASFIAPPIGNSLTAIAPGAPFLFWAALGAAGLGALAFTKEG